MCPFRHWLPLSLRVKIAQRWALGTWPNARSVDEAVRFHYNSILLDTRMMESLFLDSTHEFEHLFGLPKSLIAYRNAFVTTATR